MVGSRWIFRTGRTCAHNSDVTYPQTMSQCPRCGSTAQVHAISELADIARTNLARLQQAGAQTAAAGQPQQGWQAEPVAGPPPDRNGRRGGGLFGLGGPGSGRRVDYDFDDIGGAVAGAAIGAAAGLIGRAVMRKVEQQMTSKVMPAVSQVATTGLQNQIAVAEKYPDLRACMDDRVVFLAGGSQTQPLPDLTRITVPEADAIVAALQG